jgi:hypothetical protein
MRIKTVLLLIFYLIVFIDYGFCDEVTDNSFKAKADLLPAELACRYDDNVYRSSESFGRISDIISSFDLGGELTTKYDIFKAQVQYRFGDDQYITQSYLNNIKDEIMLSITALTGNIVIYFDADYFIKNSSDYDFDYIDNSYFGGIQWILDNEWSVESKAKSFSRQYYDHAPYVWSRNFVDMGGLLNIQRIINDQLTFKLEGSYNDRQLNRYAVAYGGTSDLTVLQMDNTWSALLNAHIILGSILQDITFEHARTDSNSYSFSNIVDSVSWAAVLRPANTLFIQLFFRLYEKTYDVSPITNADLQYGFVDEDSQDLLSAQASWDWSPLWTGTLGISRVRNESTQPGEYYIKNIISMSVTKIF